MKNNATLLYNTVLVVGDFVALILAFLGGYFIRARLYNAPVAHPLSASTYLTVFVSLLPFWILIFALLGLYTSNIYEKRFSEAGRLAIGSFIGFLFVIFWSFISTQPIFPSKLVPIYGLIFGFIFLILFRNLARAIRVQLFGYSLGLTNVLIVGTTDTSRELINWLADSRHSGYRVVGVIGGSSLNVDHPEIAQFASFQHFLEAGKPEPHSIFQTELYADEQRNRTLLEYAQRHHIAYRFVPGNTELFVGNLQVELFRNSVPVIAVHQTALIGWGRIVKRLFDVAVSALLLILSSPIILLVMLAMRLTGRGPIFFRQTRLTRFNQEFSVYKFRTLKPAYNGLSPEDGFRKMGREDLIKAYRENGDQVPRDPRFSRLGQFLRHTSLDELPQFFNVLKGDLSLVGPRALVPEELSAYEKKHTILSVKSGITGLAQVSGRRNISFEERRKLDLYYVQNWSFWLDLVIMAKTIRVVLESAGV